jgi:hypothetical protein
VRRESPSFPSSISHHAGHWCYGSCRLGGAGSGRDGSLAAEVLGEDIRLPPNASMPLHNHPNIVVLSQVLYWELEELNVDGDFDRMDVDSDAIVDDNDCNNGDARHPPLALRASFKRIKEYY